MTHPPFDGTFVNNFWGPSGFEVVQAHMAGGARTVDELSQFYKQKIQLEQEYASKLEALTKNAVGSCEGGSLKQAMDVLLRETSKMAAFHNQQAKAMSKIVFEPLQRFGEHFAEERQAIERNVRKVKTDKEQAEASVERLRAAYEREGVLYKTLRAESQLALGRELERVHAKMGKAHEAMVTNGQKYHLAVLQAAQLHDLYVLHWKLAARKLESLESERITEVRKHTWEYTNAISSTCVSEADAAEEVRAALEKVDAKRDVNTFVLARLTGNQIFDPVAFIDYQRGETEGPRSFQYATFGTQPYPTERAKAVVNHAFGETSVPVIGDRRTSEPPARLAPPATDALQDSAGSRQSAATGTSHYSTSTLFERAKSQSGSETSAYTMASSGSSKTWSSPDRRRSRLGPATYIHAPEPVYTEPKQKAEPIQPVPLVRDFSTTFDPLSKALDNLKGGGDGDMSQFRKSVRASQSAPATPNPTRAVNRVYQHEDSQATEPSRVGPASSATTDQLPAPFGSPVRTKSRTRKSFSNLHAFVTEPEPQYCINGAKVLTKAIAMYPFDARDPNMDVSMQRGDRLLVYEMMSDNWFGVQNLRTRECGTVPGNYVKHGADLF